MRFLLLVLVTLLLSSCFVRTNKLSFQKTVLLESKHSDFTKDSIRCSILIEAKERNLFLPHFMFVTDKKKSRIAYRLYGKGISGREYACRFIHLEIKNDTTVVGRSRDSLLFSEKKEKNSPKNAISPSYTTAYLLELRKRKKMNLTIEMEFEVESKNGIKELFAVKTPLSKIRNKSFKLLNPGK